MRLGLTLPQLGPLADAGRIAPFASAAEELGYGSLWVGDRLLTPLAPSDPYPGQAQPYPPEFTRALDPLIVLAAAAVATSSARLSMSTLNAPWHQPLLLGRSLTSLDQLSGGRLDVGLGMGWMRDEYRATGVPWAGRGARLEEILDVLSVLWCDDPVEHHGLLFDIPASRMDLRPVQAGGPPVLLGGYSLTSLQRVGRRAAGWLPVAGLPPEIETALWAVARQAAEGAGRDPDDLRRELRVNVRPDQSLDEVAGIAASAAHRGVDGIFFDLHYSTRSVDAALDVAAQLIGRIRGG